MANPLLMPKLGQEMTEGRVVEWLKEVGDEVAAGEPVALVETDKTTVDLESPLSGYIGVFTVDIDETVEVGATIAWILERADEAVPSVADASTTRAAPTTTTAPRIATISATDGRTTGAATTGRVRASPRARRLAEKLGVDLAAVTPTGPQGWVTVEDIEAAIALRPAADGIPMTTAASGDGRQAVTPMRRAIAAQMTRSAGIPQFRVSREVDVTDLAIRLDGQDATITDAILWASAVALVEHPALNASWVDDEPPAIVHHQRVMLGVAVAVDSGLIVPVITDADRLSLAELHHRRVELETAARQGTLSSHQLQGATFTVSNLGSLGVDHFDALVNPPEAGILAAGAARRRAVVVEDSVAVRTTITLTLAADHRVVDGATGARFLATVAASLASAAVDGGQ